MSQAQKYFRCRVMGSVVASFQHAVLGSVLLVVLLLTGCATTIVAPMDTGGSTAANVVKTAQSQIGTRYRAGGTTPSGFDCSGLIWWAYRQNGVTVPRMTAEQARAGSRVNRRAMQVGDILVFHTRQGRNGLHTGLYTGQGQFVHSPSSGKRVREDSLAQDYWDKRLVNVRRVLTSN